MVIDFNLWEGEDVKLHWYKPQTSLNDIAVIIFAGGAYSSRCEYEDAAYANFLCKSGYNAFVVDYRVSPYKFPIQLLDARRAIRFVRAKFDLFGINKNKVIVMGSSAGGHLAALVSTYSDEIKGENKDFIDKENFYPNGQILCYPVISANDKIFHKGSYVNLLGELYNQREQYSPELLVSNKTPKAFIWHTSEDPLVNVINSYRFAESLKNHDIPCEMHIFPYGVHGLGLAEQDGYITRWKDWLLQWLKHYF